MCGCCCYECMSHRIVVRSHASGQSVRCEFLSTRNTSFGIVSHGNAHDPGNVSKGSGAASHLIFMYGGETPIGLFYVATKCDDPRLGRQQAQQGMHLPNRQHRLARSEILADFCKTPAITKYRANTIATSNIMIVNAARQVVSTSV